MPTTTAMFAPAAARPRPGPMSATRYRLSVAGGLVVARSPNLPFLAAQSRDLVRRGYAAWLWDDQGHSVRLSAHDGAIRLTSPPDSTAWHERCQALIHEHP